MPRGYWERPVLTLEERVLRRVTRNPETGCLEGSQSGNGYVCVTWTERDDQGLPRVCRAAGHRIMYEARKGPIPEGYVVRHTCDNRKCVEPDHLEVGTQGDNVRDAVSRGRMKHTRWRCKLTPELAAAIFVERGRHKDIGARFGVSAALVCTIKRRRLWRAATEGLESPPIVGVLSDDDARAVFLAEGSYAEIGRRYGVSDGTVGAIKNRVNYAHLTEGLVAPPGRRLTEERVREIFCSSEPDYVLARRYSLSPSTVSGIRLGSRYPNWTRGLVAGRRLRSARVQSPGGPALFADLPDPPGGCGFTNAVQLDLFGEGSA